MICRPSDGSIERIRDVLDEINTLALEIKKLTGNQVDPFKEWVLSDYIPDIRERLLAIADELSAAGVDEEKFGFGTHGDAGGAVLEGVANFFADGSAARFAEAKDAAME